jgi:hypothetical protein
MKPKMTIEEAVEQINALGKTCWLGVGATLLDYNPRRDKEGRPMGDRKSSTPMKRFTFQGDCFTSLDGEVTKKGMVRVIYNGHQRLRYPEDRAFNWKRHSPGRRISPASLVNRVKRFVHIANNRDQYPLKKEAA